MNLMHDPLHPVMTTPVTSTAPTFSPSSTYHTHSSDLDTERSGSKERDTEAKHTNPACLYMAWKNPHMAMYE